MHVYHSTCCSVGTSCLDLDQVTELSPENASLTKSLLLSPKRIHAYPLQFALTLCDAEQYRASPLVSACLRWGCFSVLFPLRPAALLFLGGLVSRVNYYY